MSEEPKATANPGNLGSAPSLDEVLIALQKSFSRVSAKSREVAPENARSMIVGKVDFELTLRVHPEADILRYKADGNMQLKLNGVINQDIRAAHAADLAGSGPPTEPPGQGG